MSQKNIELFVIQKACFIGGKAFEKKVYKLGYEDDPVVEKTITKENAKGIAWLGKGYFVEGPTDLVNVSEKEIVGTEVVGDPLKKQKSKIVISKKGGK